MSYATIEDLLGHMAEQDLAALTNDLGGPDIDETVANHVLQDAADVVDSYIYGRYLVPPDPVPRLARLLSADIAIFLLYARRPGLDVPEAVKLRYEQALALLAKIRTGAASLGPDAVLADAGGSGGGQSGLVPGNERLFRRDQTRWF